MLKAKGLLLSKYISEIGSPQILRFFCSKTEDLVISQFQSSFPDSYHNAVHF